MAEKDSELLKGSLGSRPGIPSDEVAVRTNSREVFEIERESRSAVHEHIAAVLGCLRNPTAGTRRLATQCADDFMWHTASTDPTRQLGGNKVRYLENILTWADRVDCARTTLHLVGTTVHRSRVAAEIDCHIVMRDGATHVNHLHALFLFGQDGSLRRLKLYLDTAALSGTETDASAAKASAFLDSLTTGPTERMAEQLTEDMQWIVTSPVSARTFGKGEILVIIAHRSAEVWRARSVAAQGTMVVGEVRGGGANADTSEIHHLFMRITQGKVGKITEYTSATSFLIRATTSH